MTEFILQTFHKLRGICDLELANLTPDMLCKMTDFAAIQDLIDMQLLAIDDQNGHICVIAEISPEVAELICDELMHLSQIREHHYQDAKAKPLVELWGVALAISETVH